MVDVNRIRDQDVKVILRLGRMRVAGVKAKHREGYRYYEIKDTNLSEWEISESHSGLYRENIVTLVSKTKIHSQKRRETIHLIDLTNEGMCFYFAMKIASRLGLENSDLECLDRLLNAETIKLSDLRSDVLLRYVDFVDISARTGYNVSDFARRILLEEEAGRANDLFQGLKRSLDIAPRNNMKNSDIEIMYELVSRVEMELTTPHPRLNIAKALILALLSHLQEMAAAATIIAATIALIQFLHS